MNKQKLNKIVDEIIQEMGEIKQLGWGDMYNEDQELIATKTYRDLILTKNVPLIEILYTAMDQESFKYIMNRVGNYVSNKTSDPQPVKYTMQSSNLFFFKI